METQKRDEMKKIIKEIPSYEQSCQKMIVESGGFLPFLKKARKEKGPIFQFKITENGVKNVVLADPKYLKAVLKIVDRPRELFKFIEPLLGKYNLQVSSEICNNYRKIFRRAYAHQALVKKFPLLKNIIFKSVSERWRKKKLEIVQLQEDLFSVSLQVALALVGLYDEEIAKSFNYQTYYQAYEVALNKTFDSQYTPMSQKDADEVTKACNFIHDSHKKMIEHKFRDTSQKSNNDLDLVSLLYNTKDPISGKNIKEDFILNHISLHIIAAYHTSIIGVIWSLYYLALHKNYQKSIRDEIHTHIKDVNNVQLQELNKLKLLTNFIKESIRIRTPGPFAAREVKNEDGLNICEFHVEKGTTLLIPLNIIHSDDKLWNHSEEFKPERFNKRPNKNTYLPWGFGKRSCYGEETSKLEMKLFLIDIISNFYIDLHSKKEEIIQIERLVSMAKNDIRVKITPIEKK